MEACLTRDVPCRRFRDGLFSEITDAVAEEVRVTICVAGGACQRLHAAPVDVETLALGYAALEMLPPGQAPILIRADGLRFELGIRVKAPCDPDPSLPRSVAPDTLVDVMGRFIAEPGLWDGTGCYHRAALYDTVNNTIVARAEDVGRHNCLDRLVGYGVRHGICLSELVLLLSCRVTASLMDKALRAGFRMIVSRSAITEAALCAAREAGASLIGFAREAEGRFTVFTDALGKVGL